MKTSSQNVGSAAGDIHVLGTLVGAGVGAFVGALVRVIVGRVGGTLVRAQGRLDVGEFVRAFVGEPVGASLRALLGLFRQGLRRSHRQGVRRVERCTVVGFAVTKPYKAKCVGVRGCIVSKFGAEVSSFLDKAGAYPQRRGSRLFRSSVESKMVPGVEGGVA